MAESTGSETTPTTGDGNGALEAKVRGRVARRRVQLLQLRAQVLPRGLPGDAGDPRRAAHADGVPRERRRDGEGAALDRGRRRGLRALHDVRRLRAALPQHALHRRLLPLPPADDLRRQGDAGTRRREGDPPEAVEALGRADEPLGQRARARLGHGDGREQGARLGGRARHPDRRRDGAVRRLRGGLQPPVGPARGRAAAPGRRRRVRPHEPAVVLRRADVGDGVRRRRARDGRAQPARLAQDRHEADHLPRPARLHHDHRALPRARRGLRRVRDRPRARPDRGADPRRQDRAEHAGRAHRHLPRSLPAEQAHGRVAGPARDPAGDPGPDLRRRRPRHAVVVLLRRRLEPVRGEAGADRGDQPAPPRARSQSSTAAWTRSCPPAPGRSARSPRRARRQGIEVFDIFELVAEAAGFEV